nr:hypothetical protein GCM10020093_114030 [Planobispora longispora]
MPGGGRASGAVAEQEHGGVVGQRAAHMAQEVGAEGVQGELGVGAGQQVRAGGEG